MTHGRDIQKPPLTKSTESKGNGSDIRGAPKQKTGISCFPMVWNNDPTGDLVVRTTRFHFAANTSTPKSSRIKKEKMCKTINKKHGIHRL
jgi:hypothetical protein